MAEINISINIENDFVAQEQEDKNGIQFKALSFTQKPILETLEIREEDLISELPDSIIHHILSSLCSTRESIRTGVLSKKWQYLWTSVPILFFNDYDYFPIDKDEFASTVDRILVLRGHKKLKKLVVTTYAYTEPYQAHLSLLIRYAVLCNVEELIIDASNDEEEDFLLPEHLFKNSFFTELYLNKCIWEPIGEIHWQNLKSLGIGHQCLNQKLINSVLSGSPSLEILKLYYCHDEELDVLNITSTSLRKLVICGYIFAHNTDVLKIQAPNILSLEIRDDITISNIVLLDVRSLVEAYLDFVNSDFRERYIDYGDEMEEDMLKEIIEGLQQVNELKIGYSCLEVLSRLKAKGFPYSPNMKFPDES